MNTDEVARCQDAAKRRRKDVSVNDKPKTRTKRTKLEALKDLLANEVSMVTHKPIVNTRPQTRNTNLVMTSRGLSAVKCFDLLTLGTFFFVFRVDLTGVFELLSDNFSIPKFQSAGKHFTTNEIKLAYYIRLVTCIPANTQQSLGDYWKSNSTCGYKMPLGLHNFKLVNAHIDGSTSASNTKHFVDDLEK